MSDFGGWATKYDLNCSDGRVIAKNAFKHLDNKVVPMVWNHDHTSPDAVIGKTLLKHVDNKGVYSYCDFNDTETAKIAKELVKHGDITSLSIYANKLKQQGNVVTHGEIREVSLVLAGANPGAFIEQVICHDGTTESEEAIIYNDENSLEIGAELQHSDEIEEIEEESKEDEVIEHADPEEQGEIRINKDGSPISLGEVYNSMTPTQKAAVAIICDELLNQNEDQEGQEEETDNMKHNVFQSNENKDELNHSEFMAVAIKDAKKYGTLKESCLAHAADYGITNIDTLFPTEHLTTNEPMIIDHDTDWVNEFFNATSKSPFSRLKQLYADITEERARGYVTGTLKIEDVFGLLKRTTSPTTVYKKNKLDRDDIIDITDFDVVAFIKKEMRMKLNEEIATAILLGDRRAASDPYKIKENCIRPIYNDSDLYTIKAAIGEPGSKGKAHEFVVTTIKAMSEYEGTGIPNLYINSDLLSDLLLIEDADGRFIYESEAVLAKTLRVGKIYPVPALKTLTRDAGDSKTHNVLGVIVNPKDYTVGADKGGAVSMFEDFDIDFNQQKYLIETRCSGALLKPKTAITIEEVK